ncbi:hypothetical protein NDU88_000006 [Pleurodeles waltl]|uniref:Uncharacterized protein n=1 Tax=Pleurodeles waltl TaxID=8319 RepID=A0AAV7KLX6_PLEWA|nr:hypothetical protein NDU88_000006 [Pleurodeles waltl]
MIPGCRPGGHSLCLLVPRPSARGVCPVAAFWFYAAPDPGRHSEWEPRVSPPLAARTISHLWAWWVGADLTLFLVCVCLVVHPLPAGRAHEDPTARFLVFHPSSPPQSWPQKKERAWGVSQMKGEGGTPSYQAVRAPVRLGTHPGRAVCCLAPLWGCALFGASLGVVRGSPAALVQGEGGARRRQGSPGLVSDPGLCPQKAAGPRASRSTVFRLSVPGTMAGQR